MAVNKSGTSTTNSSILFLNLIISSSVLYLFSPTVPGLRANINNINGTIKNEALNVKYIKNDGKKR